MKIVQILMVLFSVFAATRVFFRFRSGAIGLAESMLWIGFWVVVIVAALVPDITQTVAQLIGVGRGADAVFYCGLLGLSYACFRLYIRTRELEQQITTLVRKLALQQPHKPSSS